MANVDAKEGRARRKRRIRKHVSGDTDRPRLTVFRSAKHIYAQVIDDRAAHALASVSTRSKAVSSQVAEDDKKGAANKVGKAIAEACKSKGITKVVFDRNGYAYHGRVKQLAESAREAGLEF